MSETRSKLRARFGWVCAIGIAAVLAACAVMEWWAERFLPLWILLFVPTVLLTLPLLLLGVAAAALRQWKWLAGCIACCFLVGFGFSRYRWSSGVKPGAGAFTVVTHNIGQGNKLAFHDAFPGVVADAVLLQDATHRERDYARRYPELRTRGVAQFLLLTPHEIVEAAPIGEAVWRGKPVAARFVIRRKEVSIALYNVHLPTPRRSLRHALSLGVAKEMLWIEDAPTDEHPSYRSWLHARVELARQLAEIIARETLPFVVAGDLNTPDHGMVYREFANRFTDAHAAVGRGWGYTFPADRNKDGRLARVLGPWMRLDYVFAGRGFTPRECQVAADQRSQHRSVLARLDPVP